MTRTKIFKACAIQLRVLFLMLTLALCILCTQVSNPHAAIRPLQATAMGDDVASCGEPVRFQEIDQNGDEEFVPSEDSPYDRRVRLDKCVAYPSTVNGQLRTVYVYYTTTPTADFIGTDHLSSTSAYLTQEMATEIANWTAQSWDAYLRYGFGNPDETKLGVYIFDFVPKNGGNCCGWNGDYSTYNLDTFTVQKNFEKRSTFTDLTYIVFHEMWHFVEGTDLGLYINEGVAVAMPDLVSLDFDTQPNGINRTHDHADAYLKYYSEQSLTRTGYDAGLWWKYFMEQVGEIDDEPGRGVDAMVEFWDKLDNDGLTSVDAVIKNFNSEQSFESVWIDFTVANYAKDLDATTLPEIYTYADELQTNGPNYAGVKLTQDRYLTQDTNVFESDYVSPWSAKYYQFRPSSDLPIISLDFQQFSSSKIAYTVLLIKNNQLVRQIDYIGKNYVQSFVNDQYERVTVIVTGLNENANFRYAVNATQPELVILDPDVFPPVFAGDALDPRKILIKVSILSPLNGGTPIQGLDPDKFSVTVGDESATIIDSVQVQGQYWLLARAPTQESNGLFTLWVDYSNLFSSFKTFAVKYEPQPNRDTMIAVDRSGSMAEYYKWQALSDAVPLYVYLQDVGDTLGLVSFNDEPSLESPLVEWAPDLPVEFENIIFQLEQTGGTSIGGGLQESLDQLMTNGTPGNGWNIVLLSDGLENEEPSIDDFLEIIGSRKEDGDPIPQIHTIAFGPDADQQKLERLAEETNGTYHYSPTLESENEFLVFQENSNVDPVDLVLFNLSDSYQAIGDTTNIHQQVYSTFDDKLLDSSGILTHTINVDSTAKQLLISITNMDLIRYADESSPNLGWYDLIDPNGVNKGMPNVGVGEYEIDNVTYYFIERGYVAWNIQEPQSGEWTLIINTDDSHGNTNIPFHIKSSVSSDLTLEAFLNLAPEERIIGNPMSIMANITLNEPLLNVNIFATIMSPTGKPHYLELFDDGLHGDRDANDGLFGNTFFQTSEIGSYIVDINASGYTDITDDFSRRLRLSFFMGNDNDDDNDGIPNLWENRFGTDPAFDDLSKDYDGDGLTTIEEFDNGTHPFGSDSDNGGESDYSELNQGRDPLDPSDDVVQCILDFQAFNHTYDLEEDHINLKASVLRFSVNPDHEKFALWRSNSEDGERELIDDEIEANGMYIDESVELGVEYFYWLQATDSEGNKSCIIGPRQTTPKEELFSNVYIPFIVNESAISHPDLIIEEVEVTTNNIFIVIKNGGNNVIVDPFWVDLYINPSNMPTSVNQRWDYLSDEGVAWGVDGLALPIEPNETVTLFIWDEYFSPEHSYFSGNILAESQLYIQVDSWNLETDYGAVLETHEVKKQPYNNIIGVSLVDSIEIDSNFYNFLRAPYIPQVRQELNSGGKQ